MTLDPIFFDHLKKIDHYRNGPEWKFFFETVDKLEELGDAINEEMHEDPADTSLLGAQAQKLTKQLERDKDKIAQLTANKTEYDAVYECIDYLHNHFNYKK